MAKKKIYKHHQRTTIAAALADAQPREIVAGSDKKEVVFTWSNGSTSRLTSPSFNVRDHGITEDGVTDDAAAIQALMDYVAANYDLGAGGTPDIVFTGVCKCNSGLVVPNRVNLVASQAHSAGNLNRNSARLDFSSLGVNTKALTIGEDVTIKGLVISGPGEGVSGTYGIYGGVDDSEALGVNTKILDCTVEDFETNIVLSRWLNLIAGCDIDDCKYGIHLTDAANHTVIRDNIIEPGSASPKEGIRISYGSDRGPDGVYIHDNDIESVYYGIAVLAGAGIVIRDNRFEIINKAAIDVRGRNAASDAELTVNIRDNYMYQVAANASTNGIYGILVQAGYVQIDGNEIRKYDSGANTGFQYGINFGAAGVLYNCLIGRNKIDAYQALANINDEATKRKVQSRFGRIVEYLWDLADDPGNNVQHYFRFPYPNGYTAVYSLRTFSAFNIDAIQDASGNNVAIGEIDVGYTEATPNLVAYMDNLELAASTANQVTYATDTEWTTVGKTFISVLDSRTYLIRMEPGLAVSGRILCTLVIDEFQH